MNTQYKNKLPFEIDSIFKIQTDREFNELAINIFNFQWNNNTVYRKYCNLLGVVPSQIVDYQHIPFLPISFFKTHEIKSYDGASDIIFSSSGTTGQIRSQHFIKDISVYEKSFINGFEERHGNVEDYLILGLLPSYLERESSSLIYMVDNLIQKSNNRKSGFFLDEYDQLFRILSETQAKKILLIGVSYALLEFGEKYHPNLSHCIVMETGGMKGKRKEMIKEDLHAQLKKLFQIDTVQSEYGMTELLSQAYGIGNQFKCPKWMKILTRAYNDPFQLVVQKTGGINVIDLANFYSCSFIATEDLGKVHSNHFEILGRFENSDIRGCNLLVK